MPKGVPIQAVANQSFSITLEGNLFDISLRTTNGCTVASISRNGTLLIENLICAACAPIIPSQYLESGAGNFMFLTANNQLPAYRQFNVTQQLLYFTGDELADFRVPPVASSPLVPTVTADSFNPIAQLPLRFSPQGYVGA